MNIQQKEAASVVSGAALASRFRNVRRFSESLAEPLSAEDCGIQSMPDASPTKWHLGHTTWFFETFLRQQLDTTTPFDEQFPKIFNSYYNSLGKQFSRPQRGVLSRPSLDEVIEYRTHVDRLVIDYLEQQESVTPSVGNIVEIGLQHEQQHQELLLTDIKHAFSINPLEPTYHEGDWVCGTPSEPQWVTFEEGTRWIGHEGDGFSYDNENPCHRVFLESFEVRNRLVTNAEFMNFIEDGGYERPEFWLSMGWATVNERGWSCPLYWFKESDSWSSFTLAGLRKIDPDAPVCHISYFEADAFAKWAGARLLSEAEWETAAELAKPSSGFVDQLVDKELAIHPQVEMHEDAVDGFFGTTWEWTSSPYIAFPGYEPPSGALGEYNGKFMCNQFVLKGGSCATSSSHIRKSYRNFFPPDSRWQFTGIRLARNPG